MNEPNAETFLQSLKVLVFGTKNDLSEFHCSETFYGECARCGGEPLLYYTLKENLSDSFLDRAKQQYLTRTIDTMRQQTGLTELYRLLTAAHIRFAPLKGADLAFRIYPSPALRFFNDWDVLIHPDDCPVALKVLSAGGWRSPYGTHISKRNHHYPRHYKEHFQLEPHRTLSCFSGVVPCEIWKHIQPYKGEMFYHTLSPELNLLMLARHAASGNYMHHSILKLLLDIAYLLKKEVVAWGKLRAMCKEWNLPYVDNLIAAFPDFFPASIIGQLEINPSSVAAYRELLMGQSKYADCSPAEWVMNQEDTMTFAWSIERLAIFQKKNIRMKYQLPENVSFITLLRAYAREICLKFFTFFRFLFRRNSKIRERYELIKKAERNG